MIKLLESNHLQLGTTYVEENEAMDEANAESFAENGLSGVIDNELGYVSDGLRDLMRYDMNFGMSLKEFNDSIDVAISILASSKARVNKFTDKQDLNGEG